MRAKLLAALLVLSYTLAPAYAEVLTDVQKQDVRFILSELPGAFELSVQPSAAFKLPKSISPHVMTLHDPHRLIIELPYVISTAYEFVKLKHPLIDRVEYGVYRGQTRVVVFLYQAIGQEFYAMTEPETGLVRVRFARGKGGPAAYVPPPPAPPIEVAGPPVELVPPKVQPPEQKPAESVPATQSASIDSQASKPELKESLSPPPKKLPDSDERGRGESDYVSTILNATRQTANTYLPEISLVQLFVIGVPIFCLFAVFFLRRSRRTPQRRSVSRASVSRAKENPEPSEPRPIAERELPQSTARLENCYRLVGVPRGATKEEVEASYNKLITSLRSEVLNNSELTPERIAVCQEKIKVIQDSYNRIVADFNRTAAQRRSH